jgi:hypothetical protein
VDCVKWWEWEVAGECVDIFVEVVLSLKFSFKKNTPLLCATPTWYPPVNELAASAGAFSASAGHFSAPPAFL